MLNFNAEHKYQKKMFHVKHSQGFQAKRQSCIFIWKLQGVGHEVSQQQGVRKGNSGTKAGTIM